MTDVPSAAAPPDPLSAEEAAQLQALAARRAAGVNAAVAAAVARPRPLAETLDALAAMDLTAGDPALGAAAAALVRCGRDALARAAVTQSPAVGADGGPAG